MKLFIIGYEKDGERVMHSNAGNATTRFEDARLYKREGNAKSAITNLRRRHKDREYHIKTIHITEYVSILEPYE